MTQIILTVCGWCLIVPIFFFIAAAEWRGEGILRFHEENDDERVV